MYASPTRSDRSSSTKGEVMFSPKSDRKTPSPFIVSNQERAAENSNSAHKRFPTEPTEDSIQIEAFPDSPIKLNLRV